VVREAIARLSIETERRRSAYAMVEDLIGIADGGPPDLSRKTGLRFRELLERQENRVSKP
jgi:hypothetical protein